VLTGRATLYGVLAGGEAGVDKALQILRDELERTMRLCGVAAVADIGSGSLFQGLPGRQNNERGV
jgi:(S)-mandelate dehydrogenase